MINRNPVPVGTGLLLLGFFNLTVWSDPSWHGIFYFVFSQGISYTAAGRTGKLHKSKKAGISQFASSKFFRIFFSPSHSFSISSCVKPFQMV